VKLRTWVDRAVREAAEQAILDDPQVQVELARALIGVEVLRHHAYRTVGEFLSGGAVGPESSAVKLVMAEAEQRIAATAFDLFGDGDEFWDETYLYSRAASVYGGTQQIQRSIIADRILGLPKD
jgi:alkylation response protein AidB-like acyl-CoA dehydrogenase